MIHEEICTYEVCKLAKEKGFRERCIGHYYDDTKDLYCSSVPQCYNFGGNTSDAPSQSLLQKWLREEKAIAIVLQPYSYNIQRSICTWIYEIWADNNLEKISKSFKTYELALEDALKYTLENLV